MNPEIHPSYHKLLAKCACGNQFEFGTCLEMEYLNIEVCNKCHPFFTGKQKIVDTCGRVDRFNNRYQTKKPAPKTNAATSTQKNNSAKKTKS